MTVSYREADVPPAPLAQTPENALGGVLAALHGLSSEERENVLLAAARLYDLRISFDDGNLIDIDDAERIAAIARGST